MKFGSILGEAIFPGRQQPRVRFGAGWSSFARLAGLFSLTMLGCIFSDVPGGVFWSAKAETASGHGEEQQVRIRAVIGSQLEAFRVGDAEKAFSYATPAIQTKFGTPSRFLSMVQKHYPAVYNSRTSEFVKLMEIGGVWIQGVIISDERGEAWLAQYPMELQPDGQWLIDGCIVTLLAEQAL
ncbi:MAG: DUF4864 domain-containing protein [Pseudomonadota bacterium]|nr:DUF4864 domain-containing protein [Pseudomonadota bacterium]